MECNTTLDLIELVRPGSDDFAGSEFDDARQHLESCEACRNQFAQIQKFDRAIFALATEIEVPVGLQARLLAAISADPACAKSTTSPESVSTVSAAAENTDATNRRRSVRRRAVQSICASMLLLVAAIVTLFWETPPTTYTVADLENRVVWEVKALEAFDVVDGSPNFFNFRVPTAFSSNYLLRVSDKVKGQDLDADGQQDIAIFRFSFSLQNRAPFEGIVAAIPASRLQPSPAIANSFSAAEVRYTKRDGLVAVAWWKERDLVYVCFVANPSDLETIQRELRTGTA